MNLKLLLLFSFVLTPLIFEDSFAQITSGGFGNSPFERDFGDVKLLDAYFGTLDDKIEIDAGDSNVPFTVVFANVGTQDITGIKGQLSLPLGFSASDGPGSIIRADSRRGVDWDCWYSGTLVVRIVKDGQHVLDTP